MDGRSPEPGNSAVAEFLRSRWRGETPLALVFWRDMAAVGTAVNLAMTLLALVLLGSGLSLPFVLAIHFSPFPYNIFLFVAVWRSSSRADGWAAQLAPLGAATWLVLTVFL